MRLGTKSTLLALTVYLASLGGLAWSVDRWLASVDARLTRETVRVIAGETTAQIAERSLSALEMPDPTSRRLLSEKLEDMILLSEIFSAATIVDSDGNVVASAPPVKGRRTRPSALFGQSTEVRWELSPRTFFFGGEHVAYFPLVREGALLGYVELAVHDKQVNTLYGQARMRLLAVALLGLAAVALLGGLLQVELSRRASALARALEDPTYVAGPPLLAPPADEFARPLAAAGRLRAALTLLRTLAHELKAPLSAMMIHLDLLRESLDSWGAGRDARLGQQRHVSVLREELDRLNRSLTDLLAQTMPANGAPETFDLRGAVEEVVTLLAAQARKQGVRLTTRLPTRPVTLVGYRDRLKQVLLNIVVNALEAMRDGGLLDLEVATEDRMASIVVTDTGGGIPAELLDRIYERGFTTKGEGGGIGLYVARALVQLHGGQIRAQSEPGKGTRVKVELPLVAAA